MCSVCVFDAVYVRGYAGQSKTRSIAEAFETVPRQMQVSAPAPFPHAFLSLLRKLGKRAVPPRALSRNRPVPKSQNSVHFMQTTKPRAAISRRPRQRLTRRNPNSAARRMTKRCKGSDSASSLCEDLCKRSCARSPWQVLCRSCCARSLCKAICTSCLRRSLRKISVWYL